MVVFPSWCGWNVDWFIWMGIKLIGGIVGHWDFLGGSVFASVLSWVFTTNHKVIATLYFITAMVMGLVGVGLSVLMRIETAFSWVALFEPASYNSVITAHAFIMVFFMLLPALAGGFGNWFVPLGIGAGDISFPRLNNLSLWFMWMGGCLVVLSILVDQGAGTGWTIYPPLSGVVFHPGASVDLAIFSVHLIGISSLLTSINFMATVWCLHSVDMVALPLVV